VVAKHTTAKAYGEDLFAWLKFTCFLVVTAVIPFLVMNRMASERRGSATDVNLLTLLTPGQWADGKAASATLTATLFVAATLPCLSLAYLLRGLSPTDLLLFPVSTISKAVFCAYLAVLFGALHINAIFKRVVFTGILLLLSLAQLPEADLHDALRAVFVFCAGGFAFRPHVASLMLFIVCSAALASWFLRAAAVARLSPPIFNFRRGIRVAALAVSVAMSAVLSVAAWKEGENQLVTFFSVFPLSLLFAVTSCEAALPQGYSRRVRSEIAPGRFRRTAQYLFFTGAENGILFGLLAQSLVIGLGCLAVSILSKTPNDLRVNTDGALFLACFFCYANAALLLMRTIWLVAFKSHVRPFWVPVAAWGLLVANSMANIIFLLVSDSVHDTLWIGGLPSILTVCVDGKRDIALISTIIAAITFAVAFALYLPFLVRSMRNFRPKTVGELDGLC
jgi:hypothetical protein